MQPFDVLVIYCVLVTASSLLGGWLSTAFRPGHNAMQLLMSFLGGLMMGVALLHLLPHSAVHFKAFDPAVVATVIGLVATLILVRCFHFHQHDFPSTAAATECAHDHCHPHDHSHDHDHHGHDHDHDQGSDSQTGASTAKLNLHRFSWIGLFVGLGFHTLMDGIALSASVVAEAHGGVATAWAGLGTFLIVALHKPLDSMSITLLMSASGWRGTWPKIINVVYSLICPLGALAFYCGLSQSWFGGHSVAVGWALGLSAGVFLCISLVDVLPEIQFHAHDRLRLSIALLAGVGTAYALGLIEPDHAHDLDPREPESSRQHEIPGHGH